MFSKDKKQIVVELLSPLLLSKGVRLLVQREDMNDVDCMGNKWWKLKYNLKKAIALKQDTIVTFGGAFSNHILATAVAGNITGFKTIGIIRGDELGKDLNKTLQQNSTLRLAYENGMIFYFVDPCLKYNRIDRVFNTSHIKKRPAFHNTPQ